VQCPGGGARAGLSSYCCAGVAGAGNPTLAPTGQMLTCGDAIGELALVHANSLELGVAQVALALVALTALWRLGTHWLSARSGLILSLSWRMRGPEGSCERPCCPSEAQFVRWSRDYNGAMRVGTLLRCEGRLELAQLAVAARELEQRHPLVRSTLADWGTLHCPARNAASGEPRFRVARVARADDSAWRDAWSELSHRPLRLGQGFFDAVLVAGESDHFEVLVAGEHLACDGESIMQLAHELLVLAGGGRLEGSPRAPVASFTACVRREVPSFLRHRLQGHLKYWFYLLRNTVFGVGLNVSPDAQPSAGFSAPNPQYEAELEAAAVARLREAARSRGLTLNAPLMAALAQAACEINGASATVVLSVTASMRRRYLGSEVATADIANHAACGAPALAYTEAHQRMAPQLWRLAATFARYLAGNLGNEDLCASTYWNELVWPQTPVDPPTLGNGGIVLGNWGKAPFVRDYGPRLRLRAMAPLINFSVFNCLYVGVATTFDQMAITAVGSARCFSGPQLSHFASKLTRNLEAMARDAPEPP
jgi:hypothetical protein